MQYLNYFYTQEGADLCNWGIEGKTYVVKEDGTKEYTDYMFNNPDIALADAQTMLKIHLCAKLAEPDVVCNPNILVDEEAGKLRNMYSDDTTVNDSRTMPVFSMSLEASTERAEIMRDINTYIDEMTLKFITGATPLSEFDTYMQTLKDMGIEEAHPDHHRRVPALYGKEGACGITTSPLISSNRLHRRFGAGDPLIQGSRSPSPQKGSGRTWRNM